LVVPLIGPDGVIGVIDLDSPSVARFDAADQVGIERVAAIYLAACALAATPALAAAS
jgi:GAF domain-containing protein